MTERTGSPPRCSTNSPPEVAARTRSGCWPVASSALRLLRLRALLDLVRNDSGADAAAARDGWQVLSGIGPRAGDRGAAAPADRGLARPLPDPAAGRRRSARRRARPPRRRRGRGGHPGWPGRRAPGAGPRRTRALAAARRGPGTGAGRTGHAHRHGRRHHGPLATAASSRFRLDGPGWLPLRRIRLAAADAPAVYLDDLDPYRDMPGLTLAGRLDRPAVGRWRLVLGQAWELLAQYHPGLAAGLAAGLRSLVPLRDAPRGPGRQRDVGGLLRVGGDEPPGRSGGARAGLAARVPAL